MGEFHIPPEYRLPLICIGSSIILFVFACILLVKMSYHDEPIQFSSDQKAALGASISAELVIDVSGAVVRPGVYRMVTGSRIIDAITLAGGITEQADTEYIAQFINKASILSDGAKVYIPIQGERENIQETSSDVTTQLVSINTASIDTLETLSGIGPVTAKKIIDNRPYTSIEELVSKKVISSSLLDKLRNSLSL